MPCLNEDCLQITRQSDINNYMNVQANSIICAQHPSASPFRVKQLSHSNGSIRRLSALSPNPTCTSCSQLPITMVMQSVAWLQIRWDCGCANGMLYVFVVVFQTVVGVHETVAHMRRWCCLCVLLFFVREWVWAGKHIHQLIAYLSVGDGYGHIRCSSPLILSSCVSYCTFKIES